MASTEEPTKIAPTTEAPPPPSAAAAGAVAAATSNYFLAIDFVLRFLLFASALVAVVVMVTSEQTEMVPVPIPPFLAPMTAKFKHSPAFIYFIAAFSVAGLYSIITTLCSLYAILKPRCSTKILSHFVIFDVLLLGIVASATGAAGAVAYIGLKGNSHVRWQKVCGTYGDFCRHIGGSVAVALFGSVVLVLLVLLSVYSLSKKIPK